MNIEDVDKLTVSDIPKSFERLKTNKDRVVFSIPLNPDLTVDNFTPDEMKELCKAVLEDMEREELSQASAYWFVYRNNQEENWEKVPTQRGLDVYAVMEQSEDDKSYLERYKIRLKRSIRGIESAKKDLAELLRKEEQE